MCSGSRQRGLNSTSKQAVSPSTVAKEISCLSWSLTALWLLTTLVGWYRKPLHLAMGRSKSISQTATSKIVTLWSSGEYSPKRAFDKNMSCTYRLELSEHKCQWVPTSANVDHTQLHPFILYSSTSKHELSRSAPVFLCSFKCLRIDCTIDVAVRMLMDD